jgi:hypothetical protein
MEPVTLLRTSPVRSGVDLIRVLKPLRKTLGPHPSRLFGFLTDTVHSKSQGKNGWSFKSKYLRIMGQ